MNNLKQSWTKLKGVSFTSPWKGLDNGCWGRWPQNRGQYTRVGKGRCAAMLATGAFSTERAILLLCVHCKYKCSLSKKHFRLFCTPRRLLLLLISRSKHVLFDWDRLPSAQNCFSKWLLNCCYRCCWLMEFCLWYRYRWGSRSEIFIWWRKYLFEPPNCRRRFVFS